MKIYTKWRHHSLLKETIKGGWIVRVYLGKLPRSSSFHSSQSLRKSNLKMLNTLKNLGLSHLQNHISTMFSLKQDITDNSFHMEKIKFYFSVLLPFRWCSSGSQGMILSLQEYLNSKNSLVSPQALGKDPALTNFKSSCLQLPAREAGLYVYVLQTSIFL